MYALNQQGVTLRATEQPVETCSAAGKAFLDMLGVFAEFETNLRRERQMEGIAAAKARGVYRGRKPSIDPAEVWRLYTMEKMGPRPSPVSSGSGERQCTGRWKIMSSRRSAIPADSLLQLRQRLDRLPPKSPERATRLPLPLCCMVFQSRRSIAPFVWSSDPAQHTAAIMVSHGYSPSELEHYCELIAALKLRTTNKSGRHLSTGRAIQLLEEHGVETVQGLIKSPKGLLSKQTVNRWLSAGVSTSPACYGSPGSKISG